MNHSLKTSQIKASDPPKRRRYHFWLGCFTLLLVSPLLLYYGYCWGVWGRNSLLLQYFFQCGCPMASEESRYPEDVDVLVSACIYRGASLSPDGKLLYVYDADKSYFLNLPTNEKIPFVIQNSGFSFLTAELLFVNPRDERPEYLLNWVTGEEYQIQRVPLSNTDSDNADLVDALKKANEVILMNAYDGRVVAISSDNNFFFTKGNISGNDTDRVVQFLKDNDIVYTDIPSQFQHTSISLNGKFEARLDGAYLIGTDQKIAGKKPFWGKVWGSVMGWVYDGSAVIYSYNDEPCVFRAPGYDGTICVLRVDQPLLKLNLPEEYLTPTQTP